MGQTSSQNTVLSQNWDLVPTVPTGKQSGRDDSTRKADVPGDRIVTGGHAVVTALLDHWPVLDAVTGQ